VKRTVCRTRRGRSSNDPAEILVEVGDRVRVRTEGGSPAARKYAGEKGLVTMISPGLEGIVLDVRIDGNRFDTVLEEGDLSGKERGSEPVLVGLFSGLEAQSELNQLLEELYGGALALQNNG
jgi:hypothetical protein